MSVAAIIKIIASQVTSEKGRKRLIIAAVSPLFMLIFILGALIFLIIGLITFILNCATQSNWDYVRNNIANVFSQLDYSISGDIKNSVYEFMPDFSINLSKAVAKERYNNLLIAYDTDELNAISDKMDDVANEIRACGDDELMNLLKKNGITDNEIDISFSTFRSDNNFVANRGIENSESYDTQTIHYLQMLAANNITDYKYSCDTDYVTADGKNGRKQTLTVKDKETGLTQTVEYIAIGAVEIYLPRFLALYSIKTIDVIDLATPEEAEKYDEDFAAMGEDLENAENEEDVEEVAKKYSIANGTDSKLNIFEVANLLSILQGSLDGGFVSATSNETEDAAGNTTLTLVLEAPDDMSWDEIFLGEEYEEKKDYVDEYEQTITTILDDAGIDRNTYYLSLDDMFQSALFVYFEGFFNLPVKTDALRDNDNGIITSFGEIQELHKSGAGSGIQDKGVTLDLDSADTPVMIDLLATCGSDCIEDIFIWDVYDPDSDSQINTPMTNADAITIAYLINTTTFKDLYHFDFPIVKGANYEEDEYVTMLVEYSCLDRLEYYDETYVGESIRDDVLKGKCVIGYAHNGEYVNSELSYNRDFATYIHNFDKLGEKPHLCIAIDFISGYSDSAPTKNGYNGIRNGQYDSAIVNPLLWFKSFRTDIVDDTFAGLAVADGTVEVEEDVSETDEE